MSERIRVPQYNTLLFTDVWDSEESFLNDYEDSPLKALSAEDAKLVFWLIYARHGNDPIAGHDMYQWKQRLFSIMFSYGPNWRKRLDIQEEMRELTLEELRAGPLSINNHAYNPETAPATDDTDILAYVNEQATTRGQKSIVEAYTGLEAFINEDVTPAFLAHFDNLFKKFVRPEHPVLYWNEEDDDND